MYLYMYELHAKRTFLCNIPNVRYKIWSKKVFFPLNLSRLNLKRNREQMDENSQSSQKSEFRHDNLPLKAEKSHSVPGNETTIKSTD